MKAAGEGRAIGVKVRWLFLGSMAALVALAAFATTAQAAPYATPGGGNSYNMSTLDAAAPGPTITTLAGPCAYRFHDPIIISAGDTLTIDAGCIVRVDPNDNLSIVGRLLVQGNASSPVHFDSSQVFPADGDWSGITFLGAPFAPSVLDNLSISYSTFGLRCLSCQNLTVRNLLVDSNSGDAVLVRAGSSNLTLWNITDVVANNALQSVIGVTGGTGLLIGPVNGTGVADLLTLWNVTDVTVAGPVVGTGVTLAGAWIDNATNVSVAGISGSAFPTGVMVTWSAGVSLFGATLTSPGIVGITATSVDRLVVAQVSITGGAMPAMLLLNVSNSAVSNATLSTNGVPLTINQSRAVTVNDSLLSGGVPANVWINGSSNVTMTNVTASGGLTGFLIQSSPSVSLWTCSAVGAATDGVRAIGSSSLLLDGTRLASNVGRGLTVDNSPDTRMRNGIITGNLREGIFVTASTFRISDTAVSLSTLDGLVLRNGSALNASNLQVFANGREGIWLIGGSHQLTAAWVHNNGANGTRVEGATLLIEGGVFENNTAFGVFYAVNASGFWSVAGTGRIANDEAVLPTIAVTGRLDASNASLALRGGPAYIFVMGGGELSLDDVLVDGATPADGYQVQMGQGSRFWANRTTIGAPGMGGVLAAIFQDSTVVWANVSVVGPRMPLYFINGTGTFTDVSITGASYVTGLHLEAGSSVSAVRLTIDGAPISAVDLDASKIALQGSRLVNGTVYGLRSVNGLIDLSDTSIQASAVGVRATGGAVTFSNLTILGVAYGIYADNATISGDVLRIDASLGGSDARGLWLENSTALLRLALVSTPSGQGAQVANGSSIDLVDSLIRSDSAGALVASSVNGITGQNVTLEAPAWTALVVDGATVVDLARLTIVGAAAGALILNALTVSLSNASLDVAGTALELQSNGAVAISGGTFRSGASTAILGANLGSLDGSGFAAQGAVSGSSLSRVSGLRLTGFNVTSASGPALLVDSSPDAVLTNGDLSGGAASAITGSDGASLANLTFWNGSLSVAACNSLGLADSAVLNGSVTVTNSSAVSISGLQIVVPAGATGLRLASSALASIDRLQVTGGALGISLNASTLVRISNSTVDGALRGLSAGSASSATVVNATFTRGATSGVSAYNNSTVDVWGSSIAGAPAAPSFHAVDATSLAFVRLFDTAADNATFNHSTNGTVEVYWSLTVLVRSGGVAQAGASVSLRDRSGVLAASLATDGAGLARFGPTLEFRDSQAGRSYASPFSATALTAGGLSGSRTFDLVAPATIAVDLIDNQAPTLELRPTPRIPLGGTYTFRVDPTDRDNVGIVRYDWSFSDGTGTPQFAESTVGPAFLASHMYTVSGLYPGTITVYDAAGNSVSRPFNVSVNNPPYFVHLPPPGSFFGFVGVPVQFDFSASDNDTSDIAGLTYTITGDPSAAVLGGFLVFTPGALSDYAFTVAVSDGLNSVTYSFLLLVGTQNSGTNLPPVFTSEPKKDAQITADYLYTVMVRDPEGGDVVIQLLDAPQGMSFTQVFGQPTGQLFWRPGNYYNRTIGGLRVNLTVSLRAWDGVSSNFAFQNFTLVLRDPADQPPTLLPFGDFVLAPGEIRRIDLNLYANDSDDPTSTLQWSIVKPENTEGATIGFDTESPNVLVIRAPDVFEGTRTFTVQFVVRDSSGLHAERPVGITLKGPTVAEAAFPWLLILVLIGGAGVALALATRQRAAALADEAASTARPPTPGSGSSQALMPATDAGFPVFVEGAALFDQSDNILVSVAVEGADLEDVFVLLPALARETRGAQGAVAMARVGGREAAFLREGDAILAAVGKFAGDPAPWLEDPMKLVLEQVQARGAELNVDRLEPLADDPAVKEAVRGLLAVSGGSSAEAVAKYAREASVRAASVVELVQGLVRLKVAVDNNGAEISADVRLSVEYDDKVLRFDHLEPSIEQRRDKVQLGNLRPGERKTVAFYFDPQICTRSFFNATVTWEDAKGAFHSTAMRTRAAEVVCPAFSTAKQANTAMMKRLLQHELPFRDSKYFRFPGETSAEQVFEACKQAVLAQDVRLVREFVTERPYRAEAWFYGETKVKQSPTVIWTAVFGSERVAQFSVASSAHAAITGLLAELGRRLVDSRAGGGIGAPIETMRKAEAAAQIGDRPTLLSKTKSAEADTE
jgi:hypothetical protein